MLRTSVAANEPLDPTLHDSWIANRAVYAAEWRSLDEFLGRPGASSDLLGLTVRAHDQTYRAQESIDRIVGQLGSTRLPVIAGRSIPGPGTSGREPAQSGPEGSEEHTSELQSLTNLACRL